MVIRGGFYPDAVSDLRVSGEKTFHYLPHRAQIPTWRLPPGNFPSPVSSHIDPKGDMQHSTEIYPCDIILQEIISDWGVNWGTPVLPSVPPTQSMVPNLTGHDLGDNPNPAHQLHIPDAPNTRDHFMTHFHRVGRGGLTYHSTGPSRI